MAEYIDKNATVGILEAMSRSTDCECIKKRLEKAAKRVSVIPAADVAPVRHAEWVVCGDGDNVPWMCSHCGKTTAHKYKVIYGKYCPNCGAKMDGGQCE